MALFLCLDSLAYGTRTYRRGVVAAFKKGNSQELNGYLSDKVELILERSFNQCRQPDGRGKDGMLSFPAIRSSGFTVNHQGKRDESGFISRYVDNRERKLSGELFLQKSGRTNM